ncbi:MAG: hypothetical protein R2568_03070 [Candidatus Scalindua sp.]|nr:hypothetical protein [Candidatus Scalindua sp.]MDV5165714.1 hypothetical protein [Candidatus Scalindua sp.]
MKYPRLLCILSIFAFMGIGFTGIKHVGAEEWTESFEAFKSTDDPTYHQRHNGNIEWHLFHDSAEPKGDKPSHTDIYWIEGDHSWQKRITDVKDTSGHHHLLPAKDAGSKAHSPCPLCGDATYFWLSDSDLDSDTVSFMKNDYPGWSKEDGVCRNCFECYEVRSGKLFDGKPVLSTTDEYVIGYMKSPNILNYFKNVK